MKNSTRILSTMVLSAFSLASVAQYDLAVTGVATIATASNEIAPNVPILLSIGIENLGVDIPENTTFSVIALNGTDTVSVNHQWTFVNGDYPNGATGTVESNTFTLPAAPPNVQLCGVVIIHIPDVDSTNNFSCQAFTVSSSASTDIKAQSVSINAPSDLDGFDIDGGDADPDPITDVHIVFKNVGNTTFPAGYRIPYTYDYYGATAGFVGTLAEALAPDGETQRPSVDPSFTVETETGTFKMCGYSTLVDSDPSNDTICTSFTLVDTYVPPPPIGINEGPLSGVKMFISGDAIMVHGVVAPTDVTVMDASGKLIVSEQVTKDGMVSLNNAPAGVYIIRSVNTTTGLSTMQKVAKN
jgi:hypothetical protein